MRADDQSLPLMLRFKDTRVTCCNQEVALCSSSVLWDTSLSLFLYLPIYLSVTLPLNLPIRPCACVFLCVCVCLASCLLACLYPCLLSVSWLLPICLYARLSACLLACLPAGLSALQRTCLSVCAPYWFQDGRRFAPLQKKQSSFRLLSCWHFSLPLISLTPSPRCRVILLAILLCLSSRALHPGELLGECSGF